MMALISSAGVLGIRNHNSGNDPSYTKETIRNKVLMRLLVETGRSILERTSKRASSKGSRSSSNDDDRTNSVAAAAYVAARCPTRATLH